MIIEPKCFIRNCKHYIGVFQPDGTEMSERNVCKAYPKGIPVDISYGNDKHLEIRPDQDNTTIFEEVK